MAVRSKNRHVSRGCRGVLMATLTVMGIFVAATPVGATPALTPVNSSQPFYTLANDGTYVWAGTDVSCASPPSSGTPNYVYQFTETGTYVTRYNVGPATCDAPVIASNGSQVIVVNDGINYVITVATQALNSFGEPSGWPTVGGISVAIDSTAMYVANQNTGEVVAYSLSSVGTSLWSDSSPGGCTSSTSLSSDGTNVWLGCWSSSDVVQIANTSGAALAHTTLFSPTAIWALPGTLWVMSSRSGDVAHYATTAPSTISLAGSTVISGIVGYLWADANDAWIPNYTNKAIDEVSASTTSLTASFASPNPMVAAAGGPSTLFATGDNGPLYSLAMTAPSTTSLSLPGGTSSATVATTTTLTASISTPGTVAFSENGVTVPGCGAVNATTSATCSWTPATAGSRTLRATLTPSSPSMAISSGTVTANVLPESSTTILSLAGGTVSVPVARATMLTASVSTPGTVAFSANGVTVPGCGAISATTSATCSWTPSTVGRVSVAAVLTPVSTNVSTSTGTLSVDVGLIPTSLTLSLSGSATSATVATATTLIASVSAPGTVTFSEDGVDIAGCDAVSAISVATCSWTPASAGRRPVQAILHPSDPEFAASATGVYIAVAPEASTLTLQVNGADSSTVLGGSTTVTATMSTPGVVRFTLGGVPIAACADVVGTTSASCTLTPTSLGSSVFGAVLWPTNANIAHSPVMSLSLIVVLGEPHAHLRTLRVRSGAMIKASWSPVPGASRYECRLVINGVVRRSAHVSRVPSCSFVHLRLGGHYAVRIDAFAGSAASPWRTWRSLRALVRSHCGGVGPRHVHHPGVDGCALVWRVR